MWTQAKIKFRKLLFDDSGIAMAYTIVTFLVFFMICISTYAMSENIRRKMELQNACDAAAYSAAVVQADMLSRIAVLNRALSWTYAETNKRQMDYIVDKWISAAYNRYLSEKTNAQDSYKAGACKCNDSNGGRCVCGTCNAYTWFAGTIYNGWQKERVTLNGSQTESVTVIKNNKGTAWSSEDGNILIGKNNIDVLNRELLAIKQNFLTYINKAVEKAMGAQPEISSWYYYTDGDFNKIGTASYIVREHSEEQFLNFSGNSIDGCYEKGYSMSNRNGWWSPNIIGDRNDSDAENQGIMRYFSSGLSAYIYAYANVHWHDKWGGCHAVQAYAKNTTVTGDSVKTDENGNVDQCFNGVFARPQKLADSYWGKAGSIIVAAQLNSANPWTVLFGDGGIYSQDLYFGRKLLAVSAARAGIRLKIDRAKEKPTDEGFYRVFLPNGSSLSGYTNSVWNLCEDDWDAVMLPIQYAWSEATATENKFTDKTANQILSEVYAKFNRSNDCPSDVNDVMWH